MGNSEKKNTPVKYIHIPTVQLFFHFNLRVCVDVADDCPKPPADFDGDFVCLDVGPKSVGYNCSVTSTSSDEVECGRRIVLLLKPKIMRETVEIFSAESFSNCRTSSSATKNKDHQRCFVAANRC